MEHVTTVLKSQASQFLCGAGSLRPPGVSNRVHTRAYASVWDGSRETRDRRSEPRGKGPDDHEPPVLGYRQSHVGGREDVEQKGDWYRVTVRLLTHDSNHSTLQRMVTIWRPTVRTVVAVTRFGVQAVKAT